MQTLTVLQNDWEVFRLAHIIFHRQRDPHAIYAEQTDPAEPEESM